MEHSLLQVFGTFKHTEIFQKIILPDFNKDIHYKCRIEYNDHDFSVKFSEYKRKRIEKIIVIEAPELNYPLKYSNRAKINTLRAMHLGYDEILISKNGFICDTSIANVILVKGLTLYTPDICLLAGTQRAFLLDKGIIKKRSIHIKDIEEYDYLIPINAMNSINEAQKISINNIDI